jgi:inosine-uridine nucleoside N-ribohydrolase
MFLEEFEELRGSELYPPIISMMKHFIKGIEKFELAQGALMYDPLAAYYLINPSAYKLTELEIHIETQGEFTYGMTVVDRRTWGEKRPNVSVVSNIDRQSFVRDFIRIIKS